MQQRNDPMKSYMQDIGELPHVVHGLGLEVVEVPMNALAKDVEFGNPLEPSFSPHFSNVLRIANRPRRDPTATFVRACAPSSVVRSDRSALAVPSVPVGGRRET